MPWTEITWEQYRRAGRRYASDMADAEWTLIEPFMPATWRIGRPRNTDLRAVVNAILYIASTGCQWRQFPRDFPPYSTVQGYFYAWSRQGLWARINHALVIAVREANGCEASPTAGVIDSQSVKTTESGGPRGYAAGKKIKGRKGHIVTDTADHLVGLQVHIADIQDRDGVVPLLASIRSVYPWLRHLFADGAYVGNKVEHSLAKVGRMDDQDHPALQHRQGLRSDHRLRLRLPLRRLYDALRPPHRQGVLSFETASERDWLKEPN